MTIERARELLKNSDKYSDEEIQKIINSVKAFADVVAEHIRRHPRIK